MQTWLDEDRCNQPLDENAHQETYDPPMAKDERHRIALGSCSAGINVRIFGSGLAAGFEALKFQGQSAIPVAVKRSS